MSDSKPNTEDKQVEKEEETAIEEIQILPNKRTTLLFQFLYNPEYIGVGNSLIINMDNIKAFGKITELIPEKIQEVPEAVAGRTHKMWDRTKSGKKRKGS